MLYPGLNQKLLVWRSSAKLKNSFLHCSSSCKDQWIRCSFEFVYTLGVRDYSE